MRPASVLLIAILIFGGVKAFLDSGDRPPTDPVSVPVAVDSTQQFDVEITLTFDAGADEFSLEVSDAPSLLVQLNGQPILKRTDTVRSAESPLVVRDVPGVVLGRNEIFIQASPLDGQSRPAVRVRVLSADRVKAEATLWPEFAGIVQGTLAMEVSE